MRRQDKEDVLLKPTIVGTVLQLLMVAAGHYAPAVAQRFAVGGMGISAVAGLLAAMGGRPASLGSAAANGAAAGGVCAFIGILVSWLLGDVPAAVLGFGTASSAVTGPLGGIVGKVMLTREAQRKARSA